MASTVVIDLISDDEEMEQMEDAQPASVPIDGGAAEREMEQSAVDVKPSAAALGKRKADLLDLRRSVTTVGEDCDTEEEEDCMAAMPTSNGAAAASSAMPTSSRTTTAAASSSAVEEQEDAEECMEIPAMPISNGDAAAISSAVEEQEDEDGVVFAGRTGDLALSDFPHAREFCFNFAFAPGKESTKCPNCFCFVCECVLPPVPRLRLFPVSASPLQPALHAHSRIGRRSESLSSAATTLPSA